MRHPLISFLLLIFLTSPVFGQSGVKDSIIPFPLFGATYGLYVPGGDMSTRFGVNSMLNGDVLYKNSHNLVFGLAGGFLFGDHVKQPGLLGSISTSNGQVIGYDGLYADIRIFERGYFFATSIGKIWSFKKPNPNSGILLYGGPGFIQHKIRIENIGNTVPELSKEYLKGYDHLTNGLLLHEFIGYVFFSNRQLVNFYGGIDLYQGFTSNRRDFNFDGDSPDDNNRIDLLYGIRLGWVLPLYKKKPAPYYLN